MAAVVVDSHASDGGSRLGGGLLALASVALSWMLVQTLFTLRYAELYYGTGGKAGTAVGGIDFNQERPPQYTDFAYLATSLGMTYQVSDTALQNHGIRAEALKHSLLSYLFGTVILATTISLVISLAVLKGAGVTASPLVAPEVRSLDGSRTKNEYWTRKLLDFSRCPTRLFGRPSAPVHTPGYIGKSTAIWSGSSLQPRA